MEKDWLTAELGLPPKGTELIVNRLFLNVNLFNI